MQTNTSTAARFGTAHNHTTRTAGSAGPNTVPYDAGWNEIDYYFLNDALSTVTERWEEYDLLRRRMLDATSITEEHILTHARDRAANATDDLWRLLGNVAVKRQEAGEASF